MQAAVVIVRIAAIVRAVATIAQAAATICAGSGRERKQTKAVRRPLGMRDEAKSGNKIKMFGKLQL